MGKDARPQRAPTQPSTKQMAFAVKEGRKVTFNFSNHPPIVGYLFGWDTYYWMVVTSEGKKHLIHKGSASPITLADASTYEDEIKKSPDLGKVVNPFRRWVIENIFRPSPEAMTREAAVV